jgi:cytochrome c-type biogenesis protein CcmH
MTSRRQFLSGLGAGVVGGRLLLGQNPAQDSSLAGQGEAGTLRDPWSAGKPHGPTTDLDNDPTIVSLEHRLRCPCPCGLDVYTCRTTDFTCSYSPEAHRQIVSLYLDGKSPQQIIDAFVDQYGERALMAPPPHGFNLAGYLVPGTLVLLMGGLLVAVLRRRGVVAAREGARAGAVAVPAGGSAPVRSGVAAGPPAGVTPEELAHLQQELESFDR